MTGVVALLTLGSLLLQNCGIWADAGESWLSHGLGERLQRAPGRRLQNASALSSLRLSPGQAQAAAPAPQTATVAAPSPQINTGAYDVSLGPWETQWSQADIEAQQEDGKMLLNNISDALASQTNLYVVPPGTYRISAPIDIKDTVKFTLGLEGVQLIIESRDVHFNLFNNTNLQLLGPATLDGSPCGFSQGTIIDTGNSTYIDMQLMAGYEEPSADARIVFFDPQSLMLPMYQITADSVEKVSSNPDIYRLVMPAFFWNSYEEAREAAVAVGNYVSIESKKLSGGINMNGNNGVKLANLSMHSQSLTFGLNEHGLVEIAGLRGVRRPSTNRLSAGGFVAMSLKGGSLHMYDSELSYNFDDLTDIQSGLDYAFDQISPTEVYIGFQDEPPVGAELRFYNLETLAAEGYAKIAAIEPVDSDAVTAAFQSGLTDLHLQNWNIVPSRITLDRNVSLTSNYSLVDDLQRRATSIIFENCFMHDSLASGINAKGADLIVIRNNVVSRAGIRGAAAGFDPYWWEGSIPANILIEGNTIDTTPYTLGSTTPAIATYIDTSGELAAKATQAPIHNVTVRNNVVINPPDVGIGLEFSAYNVILNNTIINPVARFADKGLDYAQPFSIASGIFLETVGGSTIVIDNAIVSADPQLVPQALRISPTTDPSGILLCNNEQRDANGIRQPLPDEFWTYAGLDSEPVKYSEDFVPGSFTAIGARLPLNGSYDLRQSSTTEANATFNFNGPRARWYSCLGPMYGMAAVYVDDRMVANVDTSVVDWPGVVPDPTVGLCGPMVFDTGNIGSGAHTLSIVVSGTPGEQSVGNATGIAIQGFDYLQGTSACTLTSSVTSSFSRAAGPKGLQPLQTFAAVGG